MRIKYGGGAGHNPSLQNYQYKKGDDAILGNKVQTSLLRWGTQERSPTPTQADGLGPALESQMRTQEPWSQECESRGPGDHFAAKCHHLTSVPKWSPPQLHS